MSFGFTVCAQASLSYRLGGFGSLSCSVACAAIWVLLLLLTGSATSHRYDKLWFRAFARSCCCSAVHQPHVQFQALPQIFRAGAPVHCRMTCEDSRYAFVLGCLGLIGLSVCVCCGFTLR